MADTSYSPGVYRQQGGNRFVVASSGSADVESGGEIDIESGGALDIGGTAFITTGGKVDLSSARNWISSGVYAPGPGKFTGGVTSTGVITGNSIVSSGTGNFVAGVTSTAGAGSFASLTSTGTITGRGFIDTLETVNSSTITALSSYGISVVGTSSQTVAVQHTVAPVTGVRKNFVVTSSVTSAALGILTTGTWNGTNTIITMATTAASVQYFEAVGLSTALWQIIWAPASSNYTLS
jgi:hypothetical protein